MKPLTLEDLSRDELLAWIKLTGFFSVRQVDLMTVRHTTLTAKSQAATERWTEAESAHAKAMQAWFHCKGNGRERNRLDRIYLDLKDAAAKARRASERAEREEAACWAAMEAEWERAR